jgi:tetratricopeptide (TPR) repeat protein
MATPEHNGSPGIQSAHRRELARVRNALCEPDGFRLIIALFNDPAYRERITAALPAGTALKIAPGAEVGWLERQLAELAHSGRPVYLTGLETWFDDDPPRRIRGLNYHRERLAEVAPIPILCWLPAVLAADLAREAPDLWAWRELVADFGTAPRQLGTPARVTADQPAVQSDTAARRLAALDRALDGKRPTTPSDAGLLLERAQLRSDLGRLDAARTDAQTALAIYREAGRVGDAASASAQVGMLAQRAGRFKDAEQHYEAALTGYRQIGHPLAEGQVLARIGHCHQAQGEVDLARHAYSRWLELTRRINYRYGEGSALGSLGMLEAEQGNVDAARAAFTAALAIARELGDERAEALGLANLALMDMEHGDPAAAERNLRRAIALARTLHLHATEVAATTNLGLLLLRTGRTDAAVALQEKALMLAKDAGDRRGELTAVVNLGSTLQASGRLDEALDQFSAAVRIAAALGDRKSEATGWEAIEGLLSALGRSDDLAGIRLRRGEPHPRSAVPTD